MIQYYYSSVDIQATLIHIFLWLSVIGLSMLIYTFAKYR